MWELYCGLIVLDFLDLQTGVVHWFTNAAAVSMCTLWGSEAGPISSPPKSTCRGPLRTGSWPSASAEPGKSVQAWCVVQALLGQAMPCCSDVSYEESPDCTLRAQIQEGPLAAALSPSLAFLSLCHFLESATGTTSMFPLFSISPCSDVSLHWLPPTHDSRCLQGVSYLPGTGPRPVCCLQEHPLQGIPRKQDPGSRYHWEVPWDRDLSSRRKNDENRVRRGQGQGPTHCRGICPLPPPKEEAGIHG